MLADTLLIIDLQKGIWTNQKTDMDVVTSINEINQRIKEYWSHDKPIIFIQHNDTTLIKNSDAWQLLDNLNVSNQDYYIQTSHANAFYNTNLNELLKELVVESVEVCGSGIEYCIDATIKMAHGLGYDVQVNPKLITTRDNEFMSAKQTLAYYEGLWRDRVATII